MYSHGHGHQLFWPPSRILTWKMNSIWTATVGDLWVFNNSECFWPGNAPRCVFLRSQQRRRRVRSDSVNLGETSVFALPGKLLESSFWAEMITAVSNSYSNNLISSTAWWEFNSLFSLLKLISPINWFNTVKNNSDLKVRDRVWDGLIVEINLYTLSVAVAATVWPFLDKSAALFCREGAAAAHISSVSASWPPLSRPPFHPPCYYFCCALTPRACVCVNKPWAG